MKNQPEPHKSRRKNSQPVRSTAGSSLQPPQDSAAQKSMVATPAIVPETPTTRVASAAPLATVRLPMNVAETGRIMPEFLANLKPEENASDAFAKMAETLRLQEEASRLTPLYIPLRPSTLQKTTTTQEISSTTRAPTTETLPEATREEDAPSISTTVTDPQHAEEVEYIVDEVLEAAERAEMGSEAEQDAGEDVMAEENTGDDEKIVEEDDDTTGKLCGNVGLDNVVGMNEEGAGDGPGDDVEGGPPATVVIEGETEGTGSGSVRI